VLIAAMMAAALSDSQMPALTCVGCGTRGFDLFSENDDVTQVHLMSRGLQFAPAIAFACRKCGMLYFVWWPKIYDWLQLRKRNAGT
jgi:hypothetical protein